MHIEAHGIEGTSRVDPVGWSDHPFIAECKNLTADDYVRPALRGTAELNIALADIPDVLIRHCIGNVMIENDAGVLRLAEEAEPLLQLNRHVKPESAQQVCIVRSCVAYAILAFVARTVFAAESKPGRGKARFRLSTGNSQAPDLAPSIAVRHVGS